MIVFDLIRAYNSIGKEMVMFYLRENRLILDAVHSVFNATFYAFLYISMFVSLIFVIMSAVSLISKKKENEYLFLEDSVPFVTVQLPTYNEFAAINCALKCLEFDYPKNKYEIIIGDDSNNAEVSSKIDAFASKYTGIVKVTRRGSNNGFKPGNLNNMLKFSKGEIITILDSDFLPEKDFLKKIVAPFQHSQNIGAVQARWKFVNQNQNLITILGAVIGLAFHHIYLPFMNKIGKISFLCGSAEAVRKDLIIGLGGWQNGALTEDIEFSMRLLNNKYDIIYLEDHECGCEVPYLAKDLYKQQMRWAFGVVSSFVQHTKTVLFNPQLSTRKKMSIQFQAIGYFFSTLLITMFITGISSFVSNAPAPIDFAKFFQDFGTNILLTSGILITSITTLIKTKNLNILGKAIISSFTYGLIVTYYVNVGIFKALFGKKMEWFMLKKNGNVNVSENALNVHY